ncbi:pinensin family lanthipeptide [Fulvivirga imtechensis]|uniref:pinensin family lanthipeptide n=1 Tax=Fulvivirga imtechensis TaxID=881893 RepID=UPI00058F49DC|nr:pinensin family lanthipeptide [Fulvivirga imtechensis]
MKKKKMDLENLRLESFVTSFDTGNEETVKGGGRGSFIICESVNICSAGCSNISYCLCPMEP